MAQEEVRGDSPARAGEVALAACDLPDHGSLAKVRIGARREIATTRQVQGMTAREEDRPLLLEAPGCGEDER